MQTGKIYKGDTLISGGGSNGKDGASTYELWKAAGNTGTVADFLESLKGEPGSSIDYPFTLADDLVTTDSTKALSARQGKKLGDDVAYLMAGFKNLAPWAFLESPNPANPAYRYVCILPSATTNIATLRYGYTSSLNDYVMSPIFDLGEIGRSVALSFSVGETVSRGQFPGIVYFNEDMQPYGYNVANANPRTVSKTIGSDIKYCRLLFNAAHLLDSYLKIGDEYLFNGADFNTAMIKGKENFKDSQYWLDWGPNSRGDWIGWNFAASDTAATGQRSDANYPIQRQVGTAAVPFSYSVSKLIELPKNVTINVEFSCGVVDSGLMIRVLNPSTGAANYYVANANPRTVSVNSATYTHVQLYFLTANYADCYIKDVTNNVILWQGAASTD